MTDTNSYYSKIMSTMDKVKYCLGIYELNKDTLSISFLNSYGVYMTKAIMLYNNGLRRRDIQKMSILTDVRMITICKLSPKTGKG